MTSADAAGEYAAIVVQLLATGAESCVESVAVVNDGSSDELLIADGGDDRFDRQVADDSLVFQVGPARPDGAITRYPLTVADPRFAAMVLSGLDDPPPLTC